MTQTPEKLENETSHHPKGLLNLGRLIGRGVEKDLLRAFFDRVHRGHKHLCLVSGYAGIGKTALVRSMERDFLGESGRFLYGKFDQYRRNVPYSGLIMALNNLVEQLAVLGREEIEKFRADIFSRLGRDLPLLARLIPEMATILGPLPALPDADLPEIRHRLAKSIGLFLESTVAPGQPLVLFLDDLQWSDQASLQVIETALTDNNLKSLLLIGAFRDNEVGPMHPLVASRTRLIEEPGLVESICLESFTPEETVLMVGDALNQEPNSVQELATRIYSLTAGNPLLIGQYLQEIHKQAILVFDAGRGRWTWDCRRLESLGISNLAADFIAGRVKFLPEKTRRTVENAAACGFRFDLQTLAGLEKVSVPEIKSNLTPAIKEGLIVTDSDSARSGGDPSPPLQGQFLHDRIRQAAYDLSTVQRKKNLHLAIGRYLLARSEEGDSPARRLEIVDHFNCGRDLIVAPREKRLIAEMNLEAGRYALQTIDVESARYYLEAGREIQGPNFWAAAQPLLLELSKTSALAYNLLGDFITAQTLLKEIQPQAESLKDKLEIAALLVSNLFFQGRYEEAARVGLEGLSLAGFHLPDDHSTEMARRLHEELMAEIGPSSVSALHDLPLSTNPEAAAVGNLIAAVGTFIWHMDHFIFYWLVGLAVRLTLRRGFTDGAVPGIGGYAASLIKYFGDYALAYEFGRAAVELSRKYDRQRALCISIFNFANFCQVYRDHLSVLLTEMDSGIKAGQQAGEYLYVGAILLYKHFTQFILGVRLPELLDQLDSTIRHLKRNTNYHFYIDGLENLRQVVLQLTG
ncbi:MAG: AAA family ATPase, partial [Deltaproteobacteria bacterium]|nr:AAA family ATPase [Deltaproteobacteria bacterium]